MMKVRACHEAVGLQGGYRTMLALSRSYVHMEYESINPDEIDALAEYAYETAETAVYFIVCGVGPRQAINFMSQL